jgi:hypothetical protein
MLSNSKDSNIGTLVAFTILERNTNQNLTLKNNHIYEKGNKKRSEKGNKGNCKTIGGTDKTPA